MDFEKFLKPNDYLNSIGRDIANIAAIPKFESPLPTDMFNHDEDCDMIDICEKLDVARNLCYKGADVIFKRCSPAEKAALQTRYDQEAKEKRAWIFKIIEHAITLIIGVAATIIALYIAKHLGLE